MREQWPYGISASRQMQPNGPIFERPQSSPGSPQGKTFLAEQPQGSPVLAYKVPSREPSPASADMYCRDAKRKDAAKAGIGIQLTQNADGSFVIENVPPGARKSVLLWMMRLNLCGMRLNLCCSLLIVLPANGVSAARPHASRPGKRVGTAWEKE